MALWRSESFAWVLWLVLALSQAQLRITESPTPGDNFENPSFKTPPYQGALEVALLNNRETTNGVYAQVRSLDTGAVVKSPVLCPDCKRVAKPGFSPSVGGIMVASTSSPLFKGTVIHMLKIFQAVLPTGQVVAEEVAVMAALKLPDLAGPVQAVVWEPTSETFVLHCFSTSDFPSSGSYYYRLVPKSSLLTSTTAICSISLDPRFKGDAFCVDPKMYRKAGPVPSAALRSHPVVSPQSMEFIFLTDNNEGLPCLYSFSLREGMDSGECEPLPDAALEFLAEGFKISMDDLSGDVYLSPALPLGPDYPIWVFPAADRAARVVGGVTLPKGAAPLPYAVISDDVGKCAAALAIPWFDEREEGWAWYGVGDGLRGEQALIAASPRYKSLGYASELALLHATLFLAPSSCAGRPIAAAPAPVPNATGSVPTTRTKLDGGPDEAGAEGAFLSAATRRPWPLAVVALSTLVSFSSMATGCWLAGRR